MKFHTKRQLNALNLVTINILVDFSRWEARRQLLADGLAALQPDVIALQEVRLPENPANWLADKLSMKHVYLSPKIGFEATREGIAILSHVPFKDCSTLDLEGQQRIAQRVQLRIGDQDLILANTHLYWQPGNSAVRLRQVGLILGWMQTLPAEIPTIICGDFNGTPETTAINMMRQHYRSAYAVVHGDEPEYTCPTPLPRSAWSTLRTFLGFFFLLRPQHMKTSWRGTLDYIFINKSVKVHDCQVVLNQPSPQNSRIFPSDHLGIFAKISLGAV